MIIESTMVLFSLTVSGASRLLTSLVFIPHRPQALPRPSIMGLTYRSMQLPSVVAEVGAPYAVRLDTRSGMKVMGYDFRDYGENAVLQLRLAGESGSIELALHGAAARDIKSAKAVGIEVTMIGAPKEATVETIGQKAKRIADIILERLRETGRLKHATETQTVQMAMDIMVPIMNALEQGRTGTHWHALRAADAVISEFRLVPSDDLDKLEATRKRLAEIIKP